jgi:hypothetical protein
MRKSVRSAPVAVLLVALGCTRAEPEGEFISDQYQLREVTRYGWETLADSTRPMSDAERGSSAGVLGDVLGVAEDSRGNVYALDAAMFKVAVFRNDGSFDHVILGGSGQGPGEFQRPRSIAIGSGGDIWIYDQISRRVHRFAPDGSLKSTVTPAAGGILNVVERSDLLYAARLARAGQPGVVVLDTLGAVVAELLTPNQDDLAQGGELVSGSVGLAPNNEVLAAHAHSGTWTRISGVTPSERFGQALFPGSRPVASAAPQGNSPPTELVYPWAVGGFADGRTFVYYAMSEVAQVDRRGQRLLAVYDRSGEYEGSVIVPADRGTFAHSLSEPEILVVQSEPFPQVVRLRLEAGRTHR